MKSRKFAIILLSIIAFGVLAIWVFLLVHNQTSEEFCVDAPSLATVWNDINSDGIKTDNEPPMSNVCVYARYTNGSDQTEEWYITQCRNHIATHDFRIYKRCRQVDQRGPYGWWMWKRNYRRYG